MARVEYDRIGKRFGAVDVMRDIHLVVRTRASSCSWAHPAAARPHSCA
jgi:hypothetical protein